MKQTPSIKDKIDALIQVENDFPGAIIVHDLKDNSVIYMNPWGLSYLKTSLQELQKLGIGYHDIYFNADDGKDYGPKLYNLLEKNNDDEIAVYFQQVRQSPDHEYVWFLASTKILLRDSTGKPEYIISTSLPVDASHYLTHKVQRLLDENNFLRNQQHVYNSLAKREKQILRLIALGHSSTEIAEQLHISEATVKTHRRNIKAKLEAGNNYDIVLFAQAFNLI